MKYVRKLMCISQFLPHKPDYTLHHATLPVFQEIFDCLVCLLVLGYLGRKFGYYLITYLNVVDIVIP